MPKNHRILIHISFWIFKIGVTTYLYTLPQVNEDMDVQYFAWRNIAEWLFTIGLFYFNYSYVVPRLLFKEKILVGSFLRARDTAASFVDSVLSQHVGFGGSQIVIWTNAARFSWTILLVRAPRA